MPEHLSPLAGRLLGLGSLVLCLARCDIDELHSAVPPSPVAGSAGSSGAAGTRAEGGSSSAAGASGAAGQPEPGGGSGAGGAAGAGGLAGEGGLAGAGGDGAQAGTGGGSGLAGSGEGGGPAGAGGPAVGGSADSAGAGGGGAGESVAPGRQYIGVYRPSEARFILDSTGSDSFNLGADIGFVFKTPAKKPRPVAGRWSPSGSPYEWVGLYDDGVWYLDTSRNNVWDEDLDGAPLHLGVPGSAPLVGDWDGDGVTDLGYVSEGVVHRAFLRWDGGAGPHLEPSAEQLPDVVLPSGFPHALSGDWNGTGRSLLVAYDGDSSWRFDRNGNQSFDGCGAGDGPCGNWGDSSQIPLTGMWSTTGRTSLGSVTLTGGDGTLRWMLDVSGDTVWSGCGTGKADRCVHYGSSTDLPVVGRWEPTD